MKGIITLLIVLATAGSVAGCGSQQASEAIKRVEAAERLLKENDAKIEEGLRKLKEATQHASKRN